MNNMTLFVLGLLWIVDTVGYITGANVVHIIDVLNELYYIFLDHPLLNTVLFTGILLIICAVLFSRIEQEIKGGAK